MKQTYLSTLCTATALCVACVCATQATATTTNPFAQVPTISFTHACIAHTRTCVNNVVYFETYAGGKKRALLFAPAVSTGDSRSAEVGDYLTGTVYTKQYFCIQSVLPLLVRPGYVIATATTR